MPDTSGLVSNAILITKIGNTSGLVKRTAYNTKMTEIENKIPYVTDLITNTRF